MAQGKKTIEELEAQVKSLKSEIMAYKRREELAGISSSSNKLSKSLKDTRIYRIAKDPNSKLGKIVRLPRTVFRIARNPEILRNIKNKEVINDEKIEKDTKRIFYPIDFFMGEYSEKRLNLVLEDYDEDLIVEALSFACSNDSEVRVVLVCDEVDPRKIEDIIKKNKIKKPKLITYYSSKDQEDSGRKTFKLEIGEKDIFVTKAWDKNE